MRFQFCEPIMCGTAIRRITIVKNLSVHVSEAANPRVWRLEVERTAKSLGEWERADLEVAWYAVDTVLDSIHELCVEFRHRDDELAVALREWLTHERTRIVERARLIADESEPAFDRIVLTVVSGIVDRLDDLARQFESVSVSRSTLLCLNPPVLGPSDRMIANEVAACLEAASSRVMALQASTRGSHLEWEVYLNLLDGARRHFDEMSREPAKLDLAA